MARTLTAANAVLFIGVAGLFDVPQQIQGFATDDVFDVDNIAPNETAMGVDGKLSAGFVPVAVKQGFTLQADSPSVDFFEQWFAAQRAAREVYFATGSTYLSSVERKYAQVRGVLTDYNPMPTAKKILQPRKFSVLWESVSPAVL